MKKKTVLIIIMLVIVLGIIAGWWMSRDRWATSYNDEGRETIELKWEEYVDVEINGYEGVTEVNLIYKDIPCLDERIKEENKKAQEKRMLATKNQDFEGMDELIGWISEINNMNDFCMIEGNKNELKNGDEIRVICDSETLKKLGYRFSEGFTYKVEGLENPRIYPFEEGYEDDMGEMEEENTSESYDSHYRNPEAIEGAYTSYDYGNQFFIEVEDFEKLDISGIEIPVCLYVEAWNLDEAIEYAKGKNVEWIQVNEKVYEKESDFTTWHPFRGMGPGGEDD